MLTMADKAYAKFPNEKPENMSVKISPGHLDRNGQPDLIRAILVRKQKRRLHHKAHEYYGDLAPSVEGALVRLSEKIPEL